MPAGTRRATVSCGWITKPLASRGQASAQVRWNHSGASNTRSLGPPNAGHTGHPLLIMDDARYVPLLGSDGSPIALLVAYRRKCSGHILDRWQQRPAEAPVGTINNTIVDHISRLLPTILPDALAKGNLFQVVGTPTLLKGLNAGTHTLMQTSTGALGTVVSTSSGQIAGQMRFAPATSLAPVVSPLALCSLLNVVAGTMQLQRINQQLGTMVRQIERLSFRQEAGVMGGVLASLKILDNLVAEYQHVGSFSSASMDRLALAEHEIASIYERNRILIDRFASQAQSVRESKGQHGVKQTTTLLQEEGETAMHDMSLLTILIAAQSKVDQLLLYNDMAHQPGFAEQRLAMAHERTKEYQAVIHSFPSMTSLEQHARQCLGEMNWLQKNIFSRSSVDKVKQVSSFRGSHNTNNTSPDLVPNFCMWKDGDTISAKLVRSPAMA